MKYANPFGISAILLAVAALDADMEMPFRIAFGLQAAVNMLLVVSILYEARRSG